MMMKRRRRRKNSRRMRVEEHSVDRGVGTDG
jgi:hypothetical protein